MTLEEIISAIRPGDPAAREVRAEHAAYLADMKRHFRPYYDAAPADELRIPLKPVGDDAELKNAITVAMELLHKAK